MVAPTRSRLGSDEHMVREAGSTPSTGMYFLAMCSALVLGVLAALLWHHMLPWGAPAPVHESRHHIALREASSLYCLGPVLHAVQSARLYADSKSFVDMPSVLDPAETLASFAISFPPESGTPSPEALRVWVAGHFLSAGSDSLFHVPSDWAPRPPHLITLSNRTLRDWALELHGLWLQLSRRALPSVREFPARFSLLWLPHPYIIPGGRFLECYHWDSFWIVLGLLRGGLVDTATDMTRNALHMVRSFGFVPNGEGPASRGAPGSHRAAHTRPPRPPHTRDHPTRLPSQALEFTTSCRAARSRPSSHAW